MSFKSEELPVWSTARYEKFQYADGERLYLAEGTAYRPVPYRVTQTVITSGKDKGKIQLFRAGWRYDTAWRGYIFPTAAYKIIDVPMELGY